MPLDPTMPHLHTLYALPRGFAAGGDCGPPFTFIGGA